MRRRCLSLIAPIHLLSLCHRASTFASSGHGGLLHLGNEGRGASPRPLSWYSTLYPGKHPDNQNVKSRLGALRGGEDAEGADSTSSSGGQDWEEGINKRMLVGGLTLNERLMRGTKPPRSLCDGCLRPHRVCVCSALPKKMPIDIKTRVIILQHSREFKRKTVGTVPIVKLLLSKPTGPGGVQDTVGGGCEVITCDRVGPNMGTFFNEHPRVLSAVQNGDTLLLFPELSADDRMNESIPSEVKNLDDAENQSLWDSIENRTLIVIDGSWSQAKAIFKQSHVLHTVPRVQFEQEGMGEYGQLRHEPKGNYMSTLESIAHSLRILEGGEAGVRVCDALIHVQRELVRLQKEGKKLKVTRAAFRRSSKRQPRAF